MWKDTRECRQTVAVAVLCTRLLAKSVLDCVSRSASIVPICRVDYDARAKSRAKSRSEPNLCSFHFHSWFLLNSFHSFIMLLFLALSRVRSLETVNICPFLLSRGSGKSRKANPQGLTVEVLELQVLLEHEFSSSAS